MRILIKEFGPRVRVVHETISDDTGKPNERFLVTLDDKVWREYGSRTRAMERALSLSQKHSKPVGS